MKRRLTIALFFAGALWVGALDKPRVTRAAIAPMEKSFDRRLAGWSIDEPIYLLGTTRGVYLEGYGVVFTAELNLVMGPNVSPFQPTISKPAIARVHQKKLDRLPRLKEIMRDMMVDSAASLDAVSPNEQVVVGVTLFHFSWEDVNGLPAQLLMQAQRKALVDYKAKGDRAALAAAIHVQEL